VWAKCGALVVVSHCYSGSTTCQQCTTKPSADRVCHISFIDQRPAILCQVSSGPAVHEPYVVSLSFCGTGVA
jgi:hypothetical protein